MQVNTRVGIDFGTSNTVAVLGSPDGSVRPLLFDGSPGLPSAVCRQPDGSLLVGRDAVHTARRHPEAFEPHPKRLVDDQTVLLGTAEVPAVDVIAAVLRRVADEAGRVGGGPPSATVLTHPVAWATRRRATLLEAAARAGLRNTTLVAEPVAAAHHFVGYATVPMGSHAVVYDFGAGTFDASVLRRTPDGFTVLASEGLADTGGLDVDAAIVAMLGRICGERDRAGWARLTAPVDADDRRSARHLWDDVRSAKEILSRTTSTFVAVPALGADMPLGRPQFEELIRPVLDRTVAATATAVRAAGCGDPAAIFLVGGSSRIPLVATLLHRRFGVAPTVLEQPELVVAQGSLAAGRTLPPAPVTLKKEEPEPDRGRQPVPAVPPPAVPVPAVPAQRRTSRRGVVATAVIGGAALAAGGAGIWWLMGDSAKGDTVSFDLVGSLENFASSLTSSAQSPADDLVATGHKDATIQLWKPASVTRVGDPIRAPFGQVTALAFSPDGRVFAAGGSDGTIVLWDVATRAVVGEVSAADGTWVYTLAFSPDSRLLAAAGTHGAGIRLWDVATRAPAGAPLSGHTMTIHSVTFGPGGLVASGSTDETVRLWDLTTRTQIGEPMTGHTETVNAVVFAPDGQTLASAADDQTVRRWNVSTRQPVGNPLAHSDPALDAVFTPDGRTLISATSDQRVMFWDTTTGTEAGRNISAAAYRISLDRAGRILSVACSGWVSVYRISR